MKKINNRLVFIFAGVLIIFFFSFFFYDFLIKPSFVESVISGFAINEFIVYDDWADVELRDVVTGGFFRLSDFDLPVVLQSFSLSCLTCKEQQDEIKKLVDSGSEVVYVSADIDFNEDDGRIVEYVESYSYDWFFVVLSSEVMQMLVGEFGFGFANVLEAPVVLICPDGDFRFLRSGVKSAEELKEEIDKC